MAELISGPAIRLGPQLAAIVAARWRLMVNSIRTTRGALELFSRIWVGLWFAMLGLGGAVGFGVAGWYFLLHQRAEFIAALLWPLFAFWQIFPLAASAFTEQVDSSNLLRYPLGYPGYVLVRLAFGSFDIATLAGSLCLLGLFVGCSLAAPALAPLAAILCLGFALFNIVLAQMIFAWLERWLARRRTREILVAVFFLAVISTNLIGPLARRWHGGTGAGAGYLRAALPVERWLPPGLPAHALAAAFGGGWGVPIAALAVLAAWVAAGLGLLHLRLRAEYRGENLSETHAAAPPAAARALPPAASGGALRRPGFSGPGFSSPAMAVAQKELRYLLRSPMMFFSLVMPVLLLVFFRMSVTNPGRRGGASAMHLATASLGFPVGVAYALLVLTNLVFNAMGTDAAGVQFYFVSPVRFRQILMGKNLAYAAILAIEVVIIYVAAAFIDGPPAGWILLATLIGIVFAALCDFSCGNLISLYLPKKIDLGRLGRQGGRGTSSIIALAVQGVIAGLAAIAVLGGVLLGRHWLTAAILAALALLAAVAYHVVLDQTDAIAQQHRETLITELSKP